MPDVVEVVDFLTLSGGPSTWAAQVNVKTAEGWVTKGPPASVVDPDKRVWVNVVMLYREKVT